MNDKQSFKQLGIDLSSVVHPGEEFLSYEALLGLQENTLTKISDLLNKEGILPSRLLKEQPPSRINGLRKEVAAYLRTKSGFSIAVRDTFQYPRGLYDAKHPISLFYYKGDINWLDAPCISIVGSRTTSEEGIKRAKKLARCLAEEGYVIVSGLAKGVDAAALSAAIEVKGKGGGIGVLGNPIDEYYPKENRDLQNRIAEEYLLISQVPFYRYRKVESFRTRKNYFPARNATMSALSQATVIIEASERSGTLTQARAALAQGRKLFILDSCFQRNDITWPAVYARKGAIRVKEIDDILQQMPVHK